MPDYTLTQFQAALRADKRFCTYANLAKKYGVNQYYLWKIVNTPGYVPPVKVLATLGIQHFELAPVCPIHHVVHVRQTCPSNKPRKHNPLAGYVIYVPRKP